MEADREVKARGQMGKDSEIEDRRGKIEERERIDGYLSLMHQLFDLRKKASIEWLIFKIIKTRE